MSIAARFVIAEVLLTFVQVFLEHNRCLHFYIMIRPTILTLLLFWCISPLSTYAQSRVSNNFSFGLNYLHGNTTLSGGQHAALNYFEEKESKNGISLKFDYSMLYALNDHLSVGVGTGIRHYVEVHEQGYYDDYGNDAWDDLNLDSRLMIPIFAQARYRILRTKVSPFVSPSVGYSFGLTDKGASVYDLPYRGGVFANLHAGATVRFGRGINIVAGPYFEYQNGSGRDKNANFYSSGDWDVKSTAHFYHIGFQVGMGF